MKQLHVLLLLVLPCSSFCVLAEGSGPVLHWGFDRQNDFGYMEDDLSGSSNDGVVSWERVRGTGGFRWAPDAGVVGGAGFLKPHTRGSIRTSTSLSLPSEWSVSVHVKPLVKKRRYADWIHFRSRGGNVPAYFVLSGGGGFDTHYFNGKDKAKIGFGTPLMEAQQWHHLVVVFRKDEVSLFLNGEETTHSKDFQWDPSLQFEVVLSGMGRQHRMEAFYDEFRVYDRALTSEEIRQLAEKR